MRRPIVVGPLRPIRAVAIEGDAQCKLKASVAHGVAALEQYRQRGAELLLIDAALPPHTGLDVVRELRSYAATVPIIMLSVDDAIAEQARSIGATCFVAKPFSISEIVQTLLEILPLEQAYEG